MRAKRVRFARRNSGLAAGFGLQTSDRSLFRSRHGFEEPEARSQLKAAPVGLVNNLKSSTLPIGQPHNPHATLSFFCSLSYNNTYMSYQVLARKWRPRVFSEMVGQEHVLRALINALDSERIHHAFLFTGTRGVGKTTVARIFAKCLNCETGVTSTPCGGCSSCKEIDEGRFVDLIEVDAASRTKVDDTRELLENVQYRPQVGRFKVYLIDEVHMLSNHSFNALLKTLEEPPPHVKFLLATTDPQKLPVTVLSRCLQFNLKRLPMSLIQGRLNQILEAENIDYETAATQLIAIAADGSVRDSLSLLDQAIAFGSGVVNDVDVRSMLGTISSSHVLDLLDALAEQDAGAVLDRIEELDESAPDYGSVLDDMISLIQRLAVAQVSPKVLDEEPDKERLESLVQRISAEDMQLFYQIALIGRRDLPLSPNPRGGFEMILLRMLAFRPVEPGDQSVEPARRVATKATAKKQVVSKADTNPAAPKSTAIWRDDLEWNQLVSSLSLQGAAKQLAANCVLGGREGNQINLKLDPLGQSLLTDNLRDRLVVALNEHFGENFRVYISVAEQAEDTIVRQNNEAERQRQLDARRSIESDPQVKALQEQFGATLDPSSIKPRS